MNALSAGDILFYALALSALAAAAVSALRASTAASARASLAGAVALALLWARAGAPGMAALQAALVAVAAAVLLLAPAAMQGDDGERARPLRSAAMPVAAWLVLALRTILMTRWPVEGTAATSNWAVPGLLHHLVFALLLLAVALLSAASRRSVRGAAIAAASAGSAVACALVALSRFTTAGAAAGQLAALALFSGWSIAGLAVAVAGEDDVRGTLPPSFSTGLATAVAGLAIALLAGTW